MNFKTLQTLGTCIFVLTLAGCSWSNSDTSDTVSIGSRLMNANINYGDLALPMNQNGSFEFNGNTNMTWDLLNTNQNNAQNSNVNSTLVVNENQNSPSTTPTPIAEPTPVLVTAKIAPELPSNPDLIAPHETPFDCGLPKNFAKRSWYDQFITSLETLQRYTPQEIASLLKSSTDKTETAKKIQIQSEDRDNLTVLCVAKDESLILSLVSGEKNGFGFKVVRYFPYRGVVDIALRGDAFLPDPWTVVPNQVGKRTGTILQLKGPGKVFSYNYVKNTLQMEK